MKYETYMTSYTVTENSNNFLSIVCLEVCNSSRIYFHGAARLDAQTPQRELKLCERIANIRFTSTFCRFRVPFVAAQ